MTKTAGTAPTIQKYTTLPGETCQCTPQTSRTQRPTTQLNQKNGKIYPMLKFVTGTINPQETPNNMPPLRQIPRRAATRTKLKQDPTNPAETLAMTGVPETHQ